MQTRPAPITQPTRQRAGLFVRLTGFSPRSMPRTRIPPLSMTAFQWRCFFLPFRMQSLILPYLPGMGMKLYISHIAYLSPRLRLYT